MRGLLFTVPRVCGTRLSVARAVLLWSAFAFVSMPGVRHGCRNLRKQQAHV